MREIKAKAHNELNSLSAVSGRQEYKQRPELTYHGEKLKLETQEHRLLSQEPQGQRDQRGTGDKIHDIRMELSSLTKEQEGNVVSSQQTSRLIKEKPPSLMERFMNGLKKLKEWFARRRREKFTTSLQEFQDKQYELIPVQWVQIKDIKSLPGYILGEYKEGIAEKVITVIEYLLKYISKAVKTVFSKLKGGNPSPEASQLRVPAEI